MQTLKLHRLELPAWSVATQTTLLQPIKNGLPDGGVQVSVGAGSQSSAAVGWYETFMPFPRDTLRLIEPLRAMRFIHFTAWCARQKADGGFSRLAPDWGTRQFWTQEIADLERQRQEIEDSLAGH